MKKSKMGNFLVVQWLGLRASTAKGPGSIPGWGTKILQAMWCSQKKKKKEKKQDVKEYTECDTICLKNLYLYSYIFLYIIYTSIYQ